MKSSYEAVGCLQFPAAGIEFYELTANFSHHQSIHDHE